MKRIFFLLIPVFVFTSCTYFHDGIRGNGNEKTESRSVGSFNSIDAGSNFDIHITQGPAGDVNIKTDENLMQYIEVRVDGDVLVVKTRDHQNLDPTNKIDIHIIAPAFRKITLSGASRLYGESPINSPEKIDVDVSGASYAKLDLSAPEIALDLDGASTIDLKGDTKKFQVESSGASNVKAYDMKADDVNVTASGASNADVTANVTLKADASGASNIRYKGNATVNQNESGAGNVDKQ